MLDNILACTGFEEPFELMIEVFGSTLNKDQILALFLTMNKRIIALNEEVELLTKTLEDNNIKQVVEIVEVKE